jgi:ATP-dependent exoDNAse (exonuclease V) alpha subunit
MTIHKSQGLTLTDMIVADLGADCYWRDTQRMAYVAMSRCKTFENLHFISFDPRTVKCSAISFNEYQRLQDITAKNNVNFVTLLANFMMITILWIQKSKN